MNFFVLFEIQFFILHFSFFIEFCEAKFLWASRFASLRSARVGLSAPSRAAQARHVVPLLSLSLSAASQPIIMRITGFKCFFIVFAPNVETLYATSLRLTYKIHFVTHSLRLM
jgi:hypothetical protein